MEAAPAAEAVPPSAVDSHLSNELGAGTVGGIDSLERDLLALAKQQSSRDVELTNLQTTVRSLREQLAQARGDNEYYMKQVNALTSKVESISQNEQREAELQNIDYLKNVMVEFICQPDSVRKNLVPVIKTLLRFTPKEEEIVHKAHPSWPR